MTIELTAALIVAIVGLVFTVMSFNKNSKKDLNDKFEQFGNRLEKSNEMLNGRIVDAVRGVKEEVAEMRRDMNEHYKEQIVDHEKIISLTEKVDDHDSRIKVIENRQAQCPGQRYD